MSAIGERIQSADWKNEKHVPAIDCPDSVKANEPFTVTATVGKEISHPNTTEHHISWIELYFKPDNDKFVYHLSTNQFMAHGAAVAGANQGPAYTDPSATATVKLSGPGTLHAVSYCNIHGLWESTKTISVG